MKRRFKCIFSLVFVAAMILSVIPMDAFASSVTYADMSAILEVKSIANLSNGSENSFNYSIKSYIQDYTDGKIARISCDDATVMIDIYSDSNYELLESKTVPMELPIWGGYFCGKDYNFFLFGQNNPKESDSVEVMRVVKYSKDWKRIGSTSIKGANTSAIFDAGTPRMYDDSGTLYVHTSHEMYVSSDGLHHQANVQLHINISDMKVKYLFADVMNVGYGYVSHSFDQYVRADGNDVFTVDLGDAYPRGVVICKKDPSGAMKKYSVILKSVGEIGLNSTGISLGGFDLSNNNCIVVGNSAPQDSTSTFSKRNIFVGIASRDLSSSKILWLTNYTDAGRVSAPKLVKISGNDFLVMWNEYDSSGKFSKLQIVRIDENGNKKAQISNGAMVSKSEPVIIDGNLIWDNCNSFKTELHCLKINNLSSYNNIFNSEKTEGLYTYRVYKNASEIVNCDKNAKEAIIPKTLGGKPVYNIEESAFRSCSSLKKLSIPDTVNTIGNFAFYYCRDLSYVIMPKKLCAVPTCCFAGCSGVEYIYMPKGVTHIRNQAFSGVAPKCIYYEGSKSDWNSIVRESNNEELDTAKVQYNVSSFGICQVSFSETASSEVYNLNVVKGESATLPQQKKTKFEVRYVTSESSGFLDGITPKFLGWSKDSNSTVAEYKAGALFKPTEDTAFYAVWDKNTLQYTINEAKYNVYKEGYELLGWTTEKGGKKVEYKAGDTLTMTDNVNLYPVFRCLAEEKTDITLSNVSSTGKIKVSWNPVEGVDHYEVYRATTKSGTYKLVKETTNTSYINTGAVAGRTYYYKVRPVFNVVVSRSLSYTFTETQYGKFSDVKYRCCDYARPEVTAANVYSSGKVKLSWNPVDGATAYKVYRATSKNGTYTLMKTVKSGTGYVNTSASTGNTYYYKVKAVGSNSSAASAYSSVVSRICKLPRPVVSASLNSSGKPVLRWDAVSGAVSYKVYRATSNDGTYKLMKTTTATNYTNTSFSANTTYYYKVKAVFLNTEADSSYSSVVSIKTR